MKSVVPEFPTVLELEKRRKRQRFPCQFIPNPDESGRAFICSVCGFQSPVIGYKMCMGKRGKRTPPKPIPVDGPGTELKWLLSKLHITDEAGCGCSQYAAFMNYKGCDWCQENIEEIINRLQAEAARRKMLFVRTAGKLIVLLAIRRGRKKLKETKRENDD